MRDKPVRSFDIVSRSVDLGDGWKLTLWEDGKEAGGGVFPVPEDNPQVAKDWWDAMSAEDRDNWLYMAGSALPGDARKLYLLAEAYEDAQREAQDWVGIQRE